MKSKDIFRVILEVLKGKAYSTSFQSFPFMWVYTSCLILVDDFSSSKKFLPNFPHCKLHSKFFCHFPFVRPVGLLPISFVVAASVAAFSSCKTRLRYLDHVKLSRQVGPDSCNFARRVDSRGVLDLGSSKGGRVPFRGLDVPWQDSKA